MHRASSLVEPIDTAVHLRTAAGPDSTRPIAATGRLLSGEHRPRGSIDRRG
jgi:hypothetical protein